MRIFKRPSRQAFQAFIVVSVIIALNVTAQLVFFRHTLNEGAVTGFLPVYTDSEDYMQRAEGLAGGDGFGEVFCDGLRMPGYPVFLSLFIKVFEKPAAAVRIAQMLLSSSLILMCWLTISSLTRSVAAGLAGALLCSLWLPFYYFSPVLYAENVCIALVGILVLALSGFDLKHPVRSLIIPSVLTALLIYMKPNHILLLPAFMALPVGMAAEKGLIPGARFLVVPALIVMILLAPWTLFVSRCQHSPVMLTTHGGWNLFLGSGGGRLYSSAEQQGSLPTRAWHYLGLRDAEDSNAAYVAIPSSMRAEADRAYRNKALERWKRQPLKLTAFGASKILHVFGFSLRGPRDLIVMLHFLISIGFSILLWKRRKWREWSMLLWAITIIIAAQSFIFLGELRFKTGLFDFPALVVSVLGSFVLLQQIFQSRSRSISG
jgi:hypothetical protein